MQNHFLTAAKEAGKQLFLECLAADDDASCSALLAAAEPEVAAEARALLQGFRLGTVVDRVFELAEPSVGREMADESKVGVTADSQTGRTSGAAKLFPLDAEEKPGSQIGNYKLLEVIGEGGMGSVFMAQQTQPVKRKVAIKVIKPGMDSRQVVARFEAERQALALMDHANIARVFDGGTTQRGRPYFVMELVKGISITEFCKRKKLPLRERLKLFINLCHGVQHAHQRGIIHRDLKPSNVLVTLYDGKPMVKIIDFGIAKAINQDLTDKTLFTNFASMVGTPLYMSPEQAELSGLDVDTRCDIYSLGVMLYELLTDTTPVDREAIDSKGIDEVRRMIRETEPPRPSQRISTVKASEGETIDVDRIREIKRAKSELSAELDWIAMRAIEKDRERRYQSASDFADDIVRYLEGEAVEACPPSATYRLRKFARRHRVFLATSTIVLMTALVGTTASLIYAAKAKAALVHANDAVRLAHKSAEERDAAANELAQQVERVTVAEQVQATQRNLAEASLYRSDIVSAAASLRSGDDAEALKLLLGHIPLPAQKDRRDWSWYYLLGQLRLAEQGFVAHEFSASGIDWHPDGSLLVTVGRERDHIPMGKLWRIDDLEPFEILHGWIYRPRWSPSGRYVATGQPGDTIHTLTKARGGMLVLDRDTNEQEVIFTETDDIIVEPLTWSHREDRIATRSHGRSDGKVEVWQRDGRQWTSQHVVEARGVAGWSKSDEYFAYLTWHSVCVLDGNTMEHLKTVELEDTVAWVGCPQDWHPNQPWVPYPTVQNDLLIVDVEQEREIARLSGDKTHLGGHAWSPDGRYLAIARQSGRIEIWSTETWQLEEQISAHDSSAASVCWHPDGDRLASIGVDGDCFIWSREPHQTQIHFDGSQSGAQTLFWSKDNQVLFMESEGALRQAAVEGQTTQVTIQLPEQTEDWELVGPDVAVTKTKLATTTKLQILNYASGQSRSVEMGHFDSKLLKFDCDPGGDRLAFAHFNPFARSDLLSKPQIIDLESGDLVALDIDRLGRTEQIAFSPDGNTVAITGGHDNMQLLPIVNLFSAETGELLDSIRVGRTPFDTYTTAAGWRSDAQQIAVGVSDGACEIWDLEWNISRLAVRHHAGPVTALAWHPTDHLIASGGADGMVYLWHTETGKLLLNFQFASSISDLDWSDDGKALAARDSNANIQVWDAARGEEVENSNIVSMKRGRVVEQDAQSALELARSHKRKGNEKNAIKILDDFLRPFGGSEKTDLEDWEQSDVLKWIPKHIFGDYQHYRGEWLRNEGKLAEAAQAFIIAQRFLPSDPSHAVMLAELRRCGIDIPEFPGIVQEFADLIQSKVDWLDRSLSQAETAENKVMFTRKKASALRVMAQFFIDCDVRSDEVVELREQIVDLAPDNASDFHLLSQAYWAVGRRANAIAAVKKALELDIDNERYQSQLNEYED